MLPPGGRKWQLICPNFYEQKIPKNITFSKKVTIYRYLPHFTLGNLYEKFVYVFSGALYYKWKSIKGSVIGVALLILLWPVL